MVHYYDAFQTRTTLLLNIFPLSDQQIQRSQSLEDVFLWIWFYDLMKPKMYVFSWGSLIAYIPPLNLLLQRKLNWIVRC